MLKKKFLLLAAVLFLLLVGVFAWRQYLIHGLKQPVLAELSDPDSAKFQDLRYLGNWTVKGGLLCGQINAKNRFGGYVGYRRFESSNGYVYIEKGEGDALKFLAECNYTDLPWWYLRW